MPTDPNRRIKNQIDLYKKEYVGSAKSPVPRYKGLRIAQSSQNEQRRSPT